MTTGALSRRDLLKGSLTALLATSAAGHSLQPRSALMSAGARLVRTGAISGRTATQADRFVDSIGVQTHLGYGHYYRSWSSRGLRDRLLGLGVRHIRDRVYNATSWQADPGSSYYRRVRDLVAHGIRLNLVTGTDGTTINTAAGLTRVQIWADGGVESLEGPNEPSDRDVLACRTTLRQLRSAVDTSADLTDVRVIAWSLVPLRNNWDDFVGGRITADPSTWAFNPADYVDFGNAHPYPNAREPSLATYTNGSPSPLECDLRMYGASARGMSFNGGRNRMILSESGYHNAVRSPATVHAPLSEVADAQYIGRFFATYFTEGVARTYRYEFLDEPYPERAPRTDPESHFGLVRRDGGVKPAYNALRNLITLLGDPGPSFTPTFLPYTVSGGDEDLRQLLLQKRDGSFWLVLWQDKPVWDPRTRTPLTVPRQTVTITFGTRVGAVHSHSPRWGTGVSPVAVSPVGQVHVSVPAEVVLVEVRRPEGSAVPQR